MLKNEAKKIISHFNKDGNPVLFLVPATTENIKLQKEALELNRQGKLKSLVIN